MAELPKLARARARSRLRYGARSSIATKAAASPAVVGCWVRAITSATGRTAARRRCPISRCSVADTIARSTKRVSSSSDWPMTSCASGGRTGGYYPMCRRRRPCPRIRWTRCERRTTQEGCTSTRARRRPAGTESDWTSDTPSASCIRWLWPAVDPSGCAQRMSVMIVKRSASTLRMAALPRTRPPSASGPRAIRNVAGCSWPHPVLEGAGPAARGGQLGPLAEEPARVARVDDLLDPERLGRAERRAQLR